jgi:prepilin-type N-terminal cleavage/methylation domain-containing protein
MISTARYSHNHEAPGPGVAAVDQWHGRRQSYLEQPTAPRNNRRLPRGFSLLELVICILILGILVAVAAPRFYSVADEATVNQIVSEARKLNQLVLVHKQIRGDWPATHKPGVVPKELSEQFPTAKFPPAPVEGSWWWVGPDQNPKYYGMALFFDSKLEDTSVFQLIEKKFDDGAKDAGWILRAEDHGGVMWYFRID